MNETMLYANIRWATKNFTDLLLADLYLNGGEADCRVWYSELQKLGSDLIRTSELVEYGRKRIALKQKLRRLHITAFVVLSFGFLLAGAAAVAVYARWENPWLSALFLVVAYLCCTESIRHANEVEVDLHPEDPNPFRHWISNTGG